MIKEKRHYLLVECTADVSAMRDFEKDLQNEMMRCIGEIDYHTVNPRFERLEGDRGFIISGTVEGFGRLIVALSMIKRIGGADIAMFTLKRSGTVTGLMKGMDEREG